KEQLKTVLEEQQTTDEKLGDILLRMKFATEEDIMRALAFQKGLVFTDLSKIVIEEDTYKIIPSDMAHRFQAIPISIEQDNLTLAMADPTNLVAIEEFENKTGMKVTAVLATARSIEKAIKKYYEGLAGMRDLSDESIETIEEDSTEQSDEGDFSSEDAPIVKYVYSIILEAIEKKASDIHFESQEQSASLRLRIDGKLKDFPGPSKRAFPAIISRIKVMSNLDIAERRLPQDGKCRIKIKDKRVDMRVSTLPTIYGEKIVIRMLHRSSIKMDMSDLGFKKEDIEKYLKALLNPHGMVLVTGPTGSGKTTTLYAGINYINEPEKNIVTIEDPVEYEMDRINQVQVKPIIDLNFANILRSVLRQDPDVIMIGEIRDRETGEISIQAALTGHMVLSTLHTNDAVSTLSRLRYLGIEPYLIADAVELVIAQRLIRKICPQCREEFEFDKNILSKLGLEGRDDIKMYHGIGCDECYGTGYSGRSAVYEMLEVNKDIKKMVIQERPDIEIKDAAIKNGMVSLRDMSIGRLIEGHTTLEEVLTVTFG
ncbi:GspE/PulE family protein, partial [Elusimicrobiota bacterium]